ncbi:NUAK family SNF1-like kinase 1 [Neocloeon triangulifer]|uniref:NUAK family SNF1-like kinase 1 n=1 Tax=Neocloeon triangulifer TaxID=2078957 RepID=UPI00286F20B8|nr:NUAK family SNF1-like kinase 1 [Neocloeon triangulifer]
MIFPTGGGAAADGAGPSGGGRARRMRGGSKKVVQWRQQNVQQGLVIVDETQLAKLIKREPIEKYYDMDPAPFATGMFASVRRCRSKETGLLFAAKFCSRVRYGEDCSAEIYHELTLLSLCSPSSRIIKLHDVFETAKEIIILSEYAPGGDLQTIIDENMVPFESDVQHFVRQLVEGLAYIHDRKIVHLDIKPQNIVMMGPFPECDIKLCDFEISRVLLEGVEVREILGTPDYVAPEIIHYEPITFGADMWSLGVTVYVLLTGFSPFGGETDQETFANISRCNLDFPAELFEDVSAEAQDFVARLLVRQPNKRMTSKECLRHPWLAKKPRTPLGGSAKNISSRSESPIMPQITSHASQKNLRKYMSKSREALFERVSGSNLRKTLSKSRERLCESQFSLVSKSREKLLMLEPSSRSIEKLYGLRSLSKSQDALSTKELFALSPALATQHRLRYQSECVGLCMRDSEAPTPTPDVEAISTPEITITSIEDVDVASKVEGVKTACIAPTKINTQKVAGGESIVTLQEENKENHIVTPLPTPAAPLLTPEPKNEEAANAEQKEETDSNGSDKTVVNPRRPGRKSYSPTSSEEEEPRYSVAQLVTAFNKNDQVAANSAKTYDKSLPSKLKFVSSFPTGANALRLFIPDIVIEESKRKRSPMPRVLGSSLDPLSEIKEQSATSPENSVSPVPSVEDSKVLLDDRNNNSHSQYLKVGSEDLSAKVPGRLFNRSGSLSSEASGYDTLSGASSLVSLEEPSPPTSLNPVQEIAPEKKAELKEEEEEVDKSSPEPSDLKPKTPRGRSSSLQVDSLKPPWGTVCIGSYSRAMERFNNKSNAKQASSERQRRKSSPLIKTPTQN